MVDGEPRSSVVGNNSVGAGSVAQNGSTRNTNTQANASSSQASGGRLSRSDRGVGSLLHAMDVES